MSNELFGFLLKYGEKEHLEEFLNGKIYLKNINYFKSNGKDTIGRLDTNENINYVCNAPYFKGKLLVDNVEIMDIDGMTLYLPDKDKDKFTHMTSFSLVEINNSVGKHSLIDERMGKFGDYVVIITDVNEFQQKLNGACKNSEKISKLSMDKIKYIDKKTFHGEVNLFYKFDNLAWQKEYRIAVRSNNFTDDHVYINIGDINDIAKLIPVDKLGFEYYVKKNINDNYDIMLGKKSLEMM